MSTVKVGIIAQKNVEIPVLLIKGWGGVSPIYFVFQILESSRRSGWVITGQELFLARLLEIIVLHKTKS